MIISLLNIITCSIVTIFFAWFTFQAMFPKFYILLNISDEKHKKIGRKITLEIIVIKFGSILLSFILLNILLNILFSEYSFKIKIYNFSQFIFFFLHLTICIILYTKIKTKLKTKLRDANNI